MTCVDWLMKTEVVKDFEHDKGNFFMTPKDLDGYSLQRMCQMACSFAEECDVGWVGSVTM